MCFFQRKPSDICSPIGCSCGFPCSADGEVKGTAGVGQDGEMGMGAKGLQVPGVQPVGCHPAAWQLQGTSPGRRPQGNKGLFGRGVLQFACIFGVLSCLQLPFSEGAGHSGCSVMGFPMMLGTWLVGMVGMAPQLEKMILEVCSNINDSMILFYECEPG